MNFVSVSMCVSAAPAPPPERPLLLLLLLKPPGRCACLWRVHGLLTATVRAAARVCSLLAAAVCTVGVRVTSWPSACRWRVCSLL